MLKTNLVENHSLLSRLGSRLKRWQPDALLLIISGGFVALLIYCFIFILNSNTQKIQYSPSDIVYTHSLKAVHAMANAPSAPISSNAASSTGAAPRMVVSEQYYDFGVVVSPQVVERTFIIANRGQSPLVIQSAYTTCGCTVADFTGSEIPPGKVALMTLHFDTGFHDLRGTTVRRGVILQTNDPVQPQVEIWVQATVK